MYMRPVLFLPLVVTVSLMTTTLWPAKVVRRPRVSGAVWPSKAATTRSAASRNWSKEVNRGSTAENSSHFAPYSLVCAAVAWADQNFVEALK